MNFCKTFLPRRRIRFLALCLVMVIALSCLSLSAAAADVPAIAAGNAEGAPGDVVRVDVTLENNPGMVATRIFVEYAPALKLLKAENGEIFPNGNAVFGNDCSADPYTLLWDESLRRDNNTQSGTLCTLTFEILDVAAGTYPITLTVDARSTFDVDLKEVTIGGCSGSVRVIREEVPDPVIAIRNYVPSRTEDYRTTITFSADVQNPVDGAQVCWVVDKQDKGASETCTVTQAKQDFTVQAKYVKDGVVLAESQTETVHIRTNFLARLLAFIRALFGVLPVTAQTVLGSVSDIAGR